MRQPGYADVGLAARLQIEGQRRGSGARDTDAHQAGSFSLGGAEGGVAVIRFARQHLRGTGAALAGTTRAGCSYPCSMDGIEDALVADDLDRAPAAPQLDRHRPVVGSRGSLEALEAHPLGGDTVDGSGIAHRIDQAAGPADIEQRVGRRAAQGFGNRRRRPISAA